MEAFVRKRGVLRKYEKENLETDTASSPGSLNCRGARRLIVLSKPSFGDLYRCMYSVANRLTSEGKVRATAYIRGQRLICPPRTGPCAAGRHGAAREWRCPETR